MQCCEAVLCRTVAVLVPEGLPSDMFLSEFIPMLSNIIKEVRQLLFLHYLCTISALPLLFTVFISLCRCLSVFLYLAFCLSLQLLDHASLHTHNHTHNHTLTHSLSLVLVVMMRSKEFKTSRSILMLIL